MTVQESFRRLAAGEVEAAVARATHPQQPLAASFPEPDRPLEIDVGTGNGDYLLLRAAAPVNLLGIEWSASFVYKAQRRALKRSLTNVLVAHAEATRYLERHVAAESVARCTVLFPDPWWKRRHRRRRVFNARLVRAVAQALVRGGTLLLASDQRDYVELGKGVVLGCPELRIIRHEERPPGSPRTKFERQFHARGLPTYELEAERR